MVARGNEYAFVGTDIKFIDKGRVHILTKDYMTESIDVFESFGEKIIECTYNP